MKNIFMDPAPKPTSGWQYVAKTIIKILTSGKKGGMI